MSLVINTNSIASAAARNLDTNQANLHRSLARLSSGSKIVIPADDAGGLAVANKLKAVMNRNVRAQQNVQNGISFLQVQDGALKTSSQILDRLSELKTMSLDVTKNTDDIANYQAEFGQLQLQLQNIRDEKFNGINLFQTSQSDLSVYTAEVGSGSATSTVAVAQVDTLGGLTGSSQAQIDVIDGLAGDTGDQYEVSITDKDGVLTTVSAAFNTDAATTAADIVTAIGANATYNALVTATVDGTDVVLTGNAGTGAFTTVVTPRDNGGTAAAINATTTGATTQEYIADSFAISIDGGTAINVEWNTDSATTAADIVAAINADSTASAIVTAAVSGSDVTITANTVGTAFAATTITPTQNHTEASVELGGGNVSDPNAASATRTATTASVTGAASAQDGPSVALSRHHLFQTGTGGSGLVTSASEDLLTTSNDISAFSIEELTAFIQNAATARAENGAQMQRLNVSLDMLKANHTNVEAARSRLADVDIATESTQLAKSNILVQSAAAMLAQANAVPSVALQLLG